MNARYVDSHHFAIQLYHIWFQTGIVELCVSPEDIARAIIVHHHRRVDVIPAEACPSGGHVVGHQWLFYSFERACRRVAHRYTQCLSMYAFVLSRYVPIIFPVVLDALACPCLATCPGEVCSFQFVRVLRPRLHVCGRKDAPFAQVIMFAVGRTLVVSGIHIQAVTIHQSGWVAQVLVFYKRIRRSGEHRIYAISVLGHCRHGANRHKRCNQQFFHVPFWILVNSFGQR